MTCDRCGNMGEDVADLRLMGMFCACMRNNCLNKWSRLSREDPNLRERENIVARLEIMRQCASGGIGNLSLVEAYVQCVDELQGREIIALTLIDNWMAEGQNESE